MNKRRILVVDDEAIARENLEHILRKEGYDVATADSGMSALKKLANTEFDLVMTDLNSPLWPLPLKQCKRVPTTIYPNLTRSMKYG